MKVISEKENMLLVSSYDKTISLLDLRTLDNVSDGNEVNVC